MSWLPKNTDRFLFAATLLGLSACSDDARQTVSPPPHDAPSTPTLELNGTTYSLTRGVVKSQHDDGGDLHHLEVTNFENALEVVCDDADPIPIDQSELRLDSPSPVELGGSPNLVQLRVSTRHRGQETRHFQADGGEVIEAHDGAFHLEFELTYEWFGFTDYEELPAPVPLEIDIEYDFCP